MAPHKLHISDKLKSWWRIFIKSHGYGKQAAAVNCGLSPCLFNSSCLYAAGAPDIPSILAHRQAALSFCRSPGIGHIQFPLRRYSGKRHRYRFSCSLLVLRCFLRGYCSLGPGRVFQQFLLNQQKFLRCIAECDSILLSENILILHRLICSLHICVVFGRLEECEL